MAHDDINYFLEELDLKAQGNELFDLIIDTLLLDPVATKNLVQQVKEFPFKLRDAAYWSKFAQFVKGVKQIQDNYKEAVSLSAKLFGNDEKRRKNGLRILGYIDKMDSEYKVDFMINATRCFLLGIIDDLTYFRLVKAIEETLYEDLLFLSSHAIKDIELKGSPQVLALDRAGLVIMAGIDANEDIESQTYLVSTLGKQLDQYAISLDNEEHWNWHKTHDKTTTDTYNVNLPTASKQDIEALFTYDMK